MAQKLPIVSKIEKALILRKILSQPAFAQEALARHFSNAERLKNGGANRDRTGDLNNAIVALSQLSYGPTRGL